MLLPERDILEINDDMSELEKFVRQEAMNYLENTFFSSVINIDHPNINSVVEKGKEVTPYIVKLYKEKGEYSNQNMYTHFFLLVMEKLYGNPFSGYVGMLDCVRYWLIAYKHNVLDEIFEDNGKDNTEKAIAFLTDLFGLKDANDLEKLEIKDTNE